MFKHQGLAQFTMPLFTMVMNGRFNDCNFTSPLNLVLDPHHPAEEFTPLAEVAVGLNEIVWASD